MSLFFTDTGKAKPARKTIALRNVAAANLNCNSCALDKVACETPKMKPAGAPKPVLYFLGEAPTRTEDNEGKPFIGPSADMVLDRIPAKWQAAIRWSNTIRCRPTKSEDIPHAAACCAGLRNSDIEQTRPKAIVGFGGAPLHALLGSDRAITKWRGRRVPVRFGTHVCWFYPMLHPQWLRESNDRRNDQANLRTFERDLSRFFADADAGFPEALVETDFHAGVECITEYSIDALKRIEDVLAWMGDFDHGVDVETNMLRPYSPDAKLLTMAVSNYGQTLAFGFEHPEAKWSAKHRGILREMIGYYLLADGRKWAHTLHMEQEWFRAKFGPDCLWNGYWGDTFGQAHILDERADVKGLDDLTQLHFGFRIKALSHVDVTNLEHTPLRDVLPYNALDAKYCYALSQVQGELLDQQQLQVVYQRTNSYTPAIVATQAKGLVRDVAALNELDVKLRGEIQKTLDAVLQDKDVRAFMAAGNAFNIASPKTVAAFFRDWLKLKNPGRKKGKPGSYSVDEDALGKIKHPVAKGILEHRGVAKLHSTYVLGLLDPDPANPKAGKYVHGDGLIHSRFSQYVTVTGRQASEDPNGQNFPRRKHKEIRRAVGCRPGELFMAADYGQLEARIIACLANDPVLIAEILNKQDIHGDWTDRIGGKFLPKRLKTERKKIRDGIKQYWTFANFYGNLLEPVAYDLARELECPAITPDALRPFFDDFWDKYKVTLAWQERLVADYNLRGYTENAFGQRRREPMNRNELINQPIQGTAGTLVTDAQHRLAFHAYCSGDDALQPITNVHDDLSFYLPDDNQLEDRIESIGKAMVTDLPDFIIVPLSVEVSIGRNWCDKEELHTFETRDFI